MPLQGGTAAPPGDMEGVLVRQDEEFIFTEYQACMRDLELERASVKELQQRVTVLEAENGSLQCQNDALKQRVTVLEAENSSLQCHIHVLLHVRD